MDYMDNLLQPKIATWPPKPQGLTVLFCGSLAGVLNGSRAIPADIISRPQGLTWKIENSNSYH